MKCVHYECLKTWISYNGRNSCEVCMSNYTIPPPGWLVKARVSVRHLKVKHFATCCKYSLVIIVSIGHLLILLGVMTAIIARSTELNKIK